MKKIIFIIALAITSCNNKTENNSLENTKNVSETSESKIVSPQKPCDLFNTDQLASVFNIEDKSTIEMYARDNFRMNTNQCQFIWPEEKGSVKTSQITVDITHKSPDDGATFSRMLELDLLKGLTAFENGKNISIMPTPIDGFNDFAYHWTQPNSQQMQRINFQIDNNYSIRIFFNCNMEIENDPNVVKNKLIEIGKIIKEKL